MGKLAQAVGEEIGKRRAQQLFCSARLIRGRANGSGLAEVRAPKSRSRRSLDCRMKFTVHIVRFCLQSDSILTL